MKIALCLSGHLRTYKKKPCVDSFTLFKRHLENCGDLEIFVSTWNYYTTLNSWAAAHNTSKANHNVKINVEEVVVIIIFQ